MKQRAWNARLLVSTRGQIIQFLRRGGRTVSDIAGELGLSNNVVRAQIVSLERDGIVQQTGVRKGVRRPEYLYALTSEAEHLFPKAHDVLFAHLIDVLSTRFPAEVVEQVLKEVGQRMTAGFSSAPSGTGVHARLDYGVSVIEALGGLAEAEYESGVIRGFRCPLGLAADGHPQVCRLAEVILSEATGLIVREQCDRTGSIPRCIFQAKNGAAHVPAGESNT